MPLNWATLRGAALVLLAALLLHALRYVSAYGGDAAEVFTDHGHEYLAFAGPVVATLLAFAAGQLALALSAARREADRRPRVSGSRPPWWLYSVLLVAIYVGQEQIEAAVNDDHPGGIDGILGEWGWLAVLLAIALGPIIAWLVGAADTLVERVGRRRAAQHPRGDAAVADRRPFLEQKFLTLLLRGRRALYLRRVEVTPRDDLVRLGSPNASWIVPEALLDSGSVCYLIGVGEDASFDLALIERFGCTVHAFDPVPRARRYGEHVAAGEPRFVFHPEGVWSEDTTLEFHMPRDPRNVSLSAVDLHGTSVAVEAGVRSLPSLMRELEHDRIDLLKISAEGAEYEILGHALDARVDVRMLCVEFSMPAPTAHIDEALGRLRAAGYELVVADLGRSGWSWRFTLVRG